MWAPADTPQDVLEAINKSLEAVMADETVQEKLTLQGARAEWYDLEESQEIFQKEYDSIMSTGKAIGISVVE